VPLSLDPSYLEKLGTLESPRAGTLKFEINFVAQFGKKIVTNTKKKMSGWAGYYEMEKARDQKEAIEITPLTTHPTVGHHSFSVSKPRSRSRARLIFLDYDDTLYPFSGLEQLLHKVTRGAVAGGGHHRKLHFCPHSTTAHHLARLDEILEQSLQKMLAHDHTELVVLTNSRSGWVQLTCSKFLPRLWQVLQQVTVVSSRDQQEVEGVTEPQVWKYLSMRQIKKEFDQRQSHQLYGREYLCWGDNPSCERAAFLKLMQEHDESYQATLNFVQRPSVLQLCVQWEMIAGQMDQLLNMEQNLCRDLQLRVQKLP
jgi:hypothetical protein